MKKILKVIELFAGIGAPRKALIRGGVPLRNSRCYRNR